MPMSPRLLRPIARSGDSDVRSYIAAVEAADQQALEQGVKDAIRDFIVGCKSDGIWSAIKASCILMGARTLSGALTPLVGAAPTNNGPFVSGDYNRKTGLEGNGTSKYLNSNRAGNADPQDSFHLAVYNQQVHTTAGAAGAYAGNGGTGTGASSLFRSAVGSPVTLSQHAARCRASTVSSLTGSNPPATGLFGVNRSTSESFTLRTGGANVTATISSQSRPSENFFVFCRNNGSGSPEVYTNARIAYYSIGESLDLALLDTRVTALYNAIGAAI